MWDSNLRPAGQCSDPRDAKKCSRLGHLGISGPTYCITSCSSVVRALVCQLNGPGSILAVPFKSAITKGKTKLAVANHHHSIVITCLSLFSSLPVFTFCQKDFSRALNFGLQTNIDSKKFQKLKNCSQHPPPQRKMMFRSC